MFAFLEDFMTAAFSAISFRKVDKRVEELLFRLDEAITQKDYDQVVLQVDKLQHWTEEYPGAVSKVVFAAAQHLAKEPSYAKKACSLLLGLATSSYVKRGSRLSRRSIKAFLDIAATLPFGELRGVSSIAVISNRDEISVPTIDLLVDLGRSEPDSHKALDRLWFVEEELPLYSGRAASLQDRHHAIWGLIVEKIKALPGRRDRFDAYERMQRRLSAMLDIYRSNRVPLEKDERFIEWSRLCLHGIADNVESLLEGDENTHVECADRIFSIASSSLPIGEVEKDWAGGKITEHFDAMGATTLENCDDKQICCVRALELLTPGTGSSWRVADKLAQLINFDKKVPRGWEDGIIFTVAKYARPQSAEEAQFVPECVELIAASAKVSPHTDVFPDHLRKTLPQTTLRRALVDRTLKDVASGTLKRNDPDQMLENYFSAACFAETAEQEDRAVAAFESLLKEKPDLIWRCERLYGPDIYLKKIEKVLITHIVSNLLDENATLPRSERLGALSRERDRLNDPQSLLYKALSSEIETLAKPPGRMSLRTFLHRRGPAS